MRRALHLAIADCEPRTKYKHGTLWEGRFPPVVSAAYWCRLCKSNLARSTQLISPAVSSVRIARLGRKNSAVRRCGKRCDPAAHAVEHQEQLGLQGSGKAPEASQEAGVTTQTCIPAFCIFVNQDRGA